MSSLIPEELRFVDESVEDFVVNQGAVNPLFQKMVDITRSAEEQLNIVKQNTLNKQRELSGYYAGLILSSSDADSGIYRDAGGNIREYRFADLNPIDAIDKQKAREASAYKSRLQPSLVADLTGKSVDELSEQDYNNVANYQYEQFQSSLNNKDYVFSPYNKEQVYSSNRVNNIPFAYKVVGKDDYGRDLIEAVNPNTGRQVSFDMSNNPYLNSSFDLYKSIDSNVNKEKLKQYEYKHSDISRKLRDAFDTDGRLSEDLDMVQSSAYQTAARALQYLPEFAVDNKKWESVANANTGQQLADAWAGVKTSTRRDFAKGMLEASNAFDEGNTVEAVLGWGTQLDRLLAESATQMGLMAAGTIATGGLAAGAGTAAQIGAAFLGAIPAGIDKTLSTMEEYKANNAGEEMTPEQVAQAFALNTATLIPESFLIGINIPKLLPKSVGNNLVKSYATKANALSRLQTVGTSVVGEAAQEGLEGATENWLSQDQSNAKSFTEHLLSDDTVKEAIIGGMMGGVMSGAANVTGAALSTTSNRKQDAAIAALKEQYNTYTPTGSKADTEASTTLDNVVENITTAAPTVTPSTPTYKATDEASKKVQQIQEAIVNNPTAKTASIDKAKATQVEIIKQTLLDEKNQVDRDSFLDAIGKSKEEVFEELVLYSGLGKDKATVVRQDGKSYDKPTTIAVKEELHKLAEKLGIDKKTTNKSMELVDYEVKHGVNGYLHFKEQIDNISSKLEDTSLSKEERTDLETKRTGWATRLAFLYNNQVDKLKQFAEHAAILEGGNTTSSGFTFKSGGGDFNLKAEYLAANEFDKGHGSHGVVQKVYTQAKALKEAISSLPESVIKELSTIPNKDINIDLTEDSLNTYLESYKKSSDNLYKGVEERASTRLEAKPLTDKTIINKLKSLAGDKLSPSGRAKLEGEVRASIVKQEGSIREYINNSAIKEEVKTSIIKELDRIKSTKEAVDTRIIETQSKEDAELKAANDFSKEVSDNVIKIIPKEDIAELQREIEKVANPLRTHKSKEANTLLQMYREAYSALNDRLKEVPIEDTKEDSIALEDTTEYTKKEPITSFRGAYNFLSNFHTSPIEYEGIVYPSVENAFQAAKTKSPEIRSKFANVSASQAKSFGRIVKLREDWNKVKISIMKELLTIKFKDKKLANLLLETENRELIEGNTWGDTYWGVSNGKGENRLGKLLMEVRESLVKELEEDSIALEDTTVSTTEEDTITPSKDELEVLEEMDNKVIEKPSDEVMNVKDYASNSLLDSSTNNSATFLPEFFAKQGKTFNLRDEIKLSINPASRIAKEGAEASYIAKVKEAMKSILLTLDYTKDKDGNIVKILSSLPYFIKDERGGYNGLWKEAPHLRLLYNFIVDGSNITFEPNDNALAAVDLSLKEFFSINGKDTFNPNSMTKSRLVGMYGYNASTVTDEQYLQIREVVSKYGIPRAKLESELGSLILDNLGLRQNISKGTVGFFEEISQGLGMFAIQYAKELGYATENVFDSEAWTEKRKEITGKEEKHAIKFNTPHIKFNRSKATDVINEYSGAKNEEGKRTGGLKDKYKLKDTLVTKPRTNIQQLPSNMTIRGTKGIMSIPPYVKKVLQKLWNTPYTVNIDLVKLVLQNKKAILERLNYMDNPSTNTDLTYDEVISQEGINTGIDREFDKLIEISKEAAKAEKGGIVAKFYFNWFMSKNMRIFMDTTEANPQTGKSLQRFLIMPEAIKRTYRIEATTKEEQTELHNDKIVMYTAIAQAFDSMKSEERITLLGEALEKFTLEELKKLQSEVINKDAKAWDKKYSKLYEYEGKKYGLEGLENLGHALLVLQHLIKIQEAKANNESTVESHLAIENDSTTSGYFLRMLAFPDPSILKNFAEKVGIIQKDSKLPMTTMHSLKQSKDFLDIYKTMAKKTAANLPDIKDVESYYEKPLVNSSILTSIYTSMDKALPKPNEDGSIGSELRKLLKSPAMIFGYTAGKTAVSKGVANDIMWDFIKTYMKINKYDSLESYIKENNISTEEQVKVKSIYDTFSEIQKYHKGNLHEVLKSKSVTEIWLKVDGKPITLNRLFEELLVPTYGNAVWEALSSSFGNHNKFNDSMNMMFTHMFQLFEKEFNKSISKLEKIYGSDIPLTEEKNAIEELFDLFPTVRLVYSNNLNESMMLMNTEKHRDNDPKNKKYKVTSPISKDGVVERTTSAANVRKFINAGKAGAVIPIHAMDGMVMAMVLAKYPNLIPVHDALVMSAKDNKIVTQEYNKLAFLLAKEFNLYDELTNRYIEVLEAYSTRNDNSKDVYDEQLVDAYGVKQNMDKDTPLRTKDFIKQLVEYNTENNINRIKFYSEPVFISNMDGIEGSGITIQPHEKLDDLLFKQALEVWGGWSNPESYRTDNDITYRLQEANVNVKERVALFDDLQNLSKELGNKVENKEHLQYLKDLVSKINPIHLNDLIVEYSKSQDFNVGMLDNNVVTIGFDNKTEIDEVTKLSPFSDKSPAEIYSHELIHAAIRFALANKDTYGFTKEVNQLMMLQKRASEVVVWEDFMPTTYDSNLKSVYEKHAKDLWDYIFNNPDKTSLRGLHEFIAHGMTNETLMSKLKDNYIVSTNADVNVKLLDKILAVVKSMFDVIFGKEKFSIAFDVAHEVIKGNLPIRYKKTIFKELEILTNKITQANTKASNRLFEQPLKFVEMLFGLIGQGRILGNNFLSPKIKYALNLADNLGFPAGWYTYAETSRLDRVKALANLTLFTLVSESRRKALATWLREVVGLSQQGAVQSILREVSGPDRQTSMLDQLSALTRMVEQSSKALETTVLFEMLDKFDKKSLNTEESTGLTTVLLQTDLSSIFEYNEETKQSNVEEVIKLLKDSTLLNSRIEELEDKLIQSKEGLWYLNQSLALAHYMTTGRGNERLNLNASNIATGKLYGKAIDASKETIKDIDTLTSLYALQMTNSQTREVVANLKKEGLENYLLTHKNFVKDTLIGVEVENILGVKTKVKTIDQLHTVKGYHKQLLDTSFDIEVDFAKNAEKRAKEGFKIVKILGNNDITGTTGLALYKRTFATPNRRDGSSFISIGAKAIGTTLDESANDLLSNNLTSTSYEEIKDLHRIYKQRAMTVSNKLKYTMANSRLTIKEIQRMSEGYTPILSPLAHNDGIADFRITMDYTTKVNELNQDLDGLKVLSKMYATQNTKSYASIKNKELVNWLKQDMKNNMNEFKRDKDNHKYILLSKSTDNKFLQEAWNFIPKELMDEIKKGDFYVREDWLQDLFGVPSTSLNELGVINKVAPTQIKRGIAIGEYIMKIIAYMAKQNIVIRVPAVLIGNILSNFNYSVATGSNPASVLKKTLENSRNIRDYIDTKKELNRIMFRKRLGTVTEKELKQINWYETKLEHNPVHSLMQKGMYQAIIEDINMDELESIGKISKFIKDNKLAKYVPKPLRWFTKQLYMTEGTLLYDLMFQTTQYSDFVARATEYQLKMEKAPTKYREIIKEGKRTKVVTNEYLEYEEALTIDVWNAFINYDKPQSTLEQYFSDMGLIMFFKYAKRIQHIITKGIVDNPVGVMGFLVTQSFLHNPEHIYEQNLFNKSWSSLFHSPVDNFINAITPMPMQYYLGMRKLSL